MPSTCDRSYFAGRAAQERAMADRATSAQSDAIHRLLAELYDMRAGGGPAALRLVADAPAAMLDERQLA